MDLVTVTHCQSDFDAKLLVDFLEVKGIRAYTSGGPASLAGAAAGVPYGVTIQVDKKDADAAAKLLKERTAKTETSRNWAAKVSTGCAWFVVALLVIVPLALFLGWLFG